MKCLAVTTTHPTGALAQADWVLAGFAFCQPAEWLAEIGSWVD
jgi:hypothetical protein